MRRGVMFGVTVGALLLTSRHASADLTLLEHDGWTFFTDGRINSYFSAAAGDDFPAPTPQPNVDPATGMKLSHAPLTVNHGVIGTGGQYFTAGFPNDQGFNGNYFGTRVRSGFLGSIIAFGMKKQVTEWTTVKSYMSLWGTSEAYARDRTQDAGMSTSKGFDAREAWIGLDGPWGSLTAGRQSGILGGISTEIDFLYAHNFAVGLPCLEIYYPTCGHIGTGALGPGFAAGFTYVTPSLAGLRIKLGLYDPVRLLGAWERVPYPRPEGAIWYERRFSPKLLVKVQGEGMYQYMDQLGDNASMGYPLKDKVWGLAGGGRLEAGPLRFGISAFRGKGLGTYVALQNAGSTFRSAAPYQFRYFTGYYAQLAAVFGREQVSLGAGRVKDDLLPDDKIDSGNSNLKYQSGVSAVFAHRVTENLIVALDYFLFRTDWWGAPLTTTDATGKLVNVGMLPGEKQVVHFINLGATFHW